MDRFNATERQAVYESARPYNDNFNNYGKDSYSNSGASQNSDYNRTYQPYATNNNSPINPYERIPNNSRVQYSYDQAYHPPQPQIIIIEVPERADYDEERRYHECHKHGGKGRAVAQIGSLALAALGAVNFGFQNRNGGFYMGNGGFGRWGGAYNRGWNGGCGGGWNGGYGGGWNGGYGGGWNGGYGGGRNGGYGGGWNGGYGGGWNGGYGGGWNRSYGFVNQMIHSFRGNRRY